MWKSATTLHIVPLNTPMHILSPPSPPLTSHQTVKQGGKESWEGKRDFCFMLCCSLIPFDYLVDAFFPLAPPPSLLLFPNGLVMIQLKPDPWWEHPLGLGREMWYRKKNWRKVEGGKKRNKNCVKEMKVGFEREKDGIIKGEWARVYHAAHAEESWSAYKSKCLR